MSLGSCVTDLVGIDCKKFVIHLKGRTLSAMIKLLISSSVMVIKVTGNFTQSSWLLRDDVIFFPSLCDLKKIKPACCAQWEHNNEVWLMGLACLRPLWRASTLSPWASVHVVPICWVTRGLDNPLWFISRTPFLHPRLLSVEQVKWEIVFPGIWPMRLHPFFFSHEIHTREKGKAGLSPPENQPLCLFSCTENSPLFSHWRGTERERGREGRQNLLGD